jgi:HlyD family secretion protein
LAVYASQIYQRNVEPGEYVSPGVPLVTLIDLADVWITSIFARIS